jgi:ABC-2 type transport system ATP-binding protein
MSVLGHEIPREAEALRRKVGYMTQKFSLYEDLTVKENLDFIADVYNLPSERRGRRIMEVSERYGLGRITRQRAGTLSGGQKQRLALACATLHEPELLFLDEPTSAVDPENRRAFWESLFDLVEENTTILVSTHYMDEAERCHALAILDHGRLVAEGSPAQLSRDIDAQVIVVETTQPRQAGRLLHQQPWVRSVAQIGNQLRVLIRKDFTDAAAAVRGVIESDCGHVSECAPDSASLEDVFVAATLKKKRQDAAA